MNPEILKQALQATDQYLGIEKKILAGDKTDQALHDFTYWYSRAHDMLDMLGVQDEHQEYMQHHVNVVWKALEHHDMNLGDEPGTHTPRADMGEELPEQYIHEEKDDSLKNQHMKHFDTEEKLDRIANGLRWEHIADTYDEEQIAEEDEEEDDEEDEENEQDEDIKEDKDPCWDGYQMIGMKKKNGKNVPNCVPVSEGISATTRMRKAQGMRSKAARLATARKIKLKRASNPTELRNRAVVGARRLMMQKLLHGRNKATLSPTEKDMIEERLRQMKGAQVALANKLIPKIKQLETRRLSAKHK